MAPVTKRARNETKGKIKTKGNSDSEDSSPQEDLVEPQSDEDSLNQSDEDEDEDVSGNSSTDTETEISRARNTKSKKTLSECIHRATSPTAFGGTLEALLATSVPSNIQPGAPLALKPSIARKKNDEKLELKAKRILESEKKEREEKGRVQDVIGGWDNQNERSLRKVAQRGGIYYSWFRSLSLAHLLSRPVVHLFNAIQQAQSASAATLEENKKLRGSGKPTLPAPSPHEIGRNKPGNKNKNKAIGKDAAGGLDKNSFLDAIRSGGVVRQS
ncbi:Rrp15p domain-containing protein [Rhizoctonia solani AG-1 IA]|uniref:Rrp15p domain-containing protein n=1 Tax=Thanatephorus cucumeris (strain AG1-IA) TaxID=983506 RepID=L8X5Z5_THACA|nr:Rrp15p domain-containing protein [Rhizoctonia solani AG-1 IA]